MRLYKSASILIFMISMNALSSINVSLLSLSEEPNPIRKVISNFSLNYFAQYTGPSLGSGYKEGSTYNRFDGGTSQDGKKYDSTGSTQLYQSFKVGYKLPKNMVVSYGVTFQRNLTDDVEYSQTNGTKSTRSNGTSYNNHRASLWIPSVLTGKFASLSLNLYYELPTEKSTNTINESARGGFEFQEIVARNETEVDMEYQYGVGIQPTLAIFSSVRGLFHGLTASYERYVFPDYVKEYDKFPFWCERNNNCTGVDKISYTYQAQGAKASLGGYVNYQLTDKLTLKSNVEFDWDQLGDQVGTLNDWGNNMDNVGNLSVAYRVMNQMTLESGINFSIEEASIDKTSIFGSINISL